MTRLHQDTIDAIVLAAGKGTRMQSSLPKVLHHLLGKPMLEYVLDNLMSSGVRKTILVLSKDIAPFENLLNKYPLTLVCIQNHAKGTADAVASTAVFFEKVERPNYLDSQVFKGQRFLSDWVVICTGDVPTFQPKMLSEFKNKALSLDADIAVLGFEPENPMGYGRLICDNNNNILNIVEENECNEEQKKIRLCNSGIILAKTQKLFQALSKVSNNNSKKEYYLTDIISIGIKMEMKVTYVLGSPWYYLVGINTPQQLEELSDILQNNS